MENMVYYGEKKGKHSKTCKPGDPQVRNDKFNVGSHKIYYSNGKYYWGSVNIYTPSAGIPSTGIHGVFIMKKMDLLLICI